MINHDFTRNKIFDIAGILREMARYAKNYKKSQVELTTNNTYSEVYKNEKLSELREAYRAKHSDTKSRIIPLLEEIATAETENENILNFDTPELSEAVNAINILQGKVPGQIIDRLKVKFAGQYQALLLIAAVFERFGVDLKPYGYDEYTRLSEMIINDIIIMVENLEHDEISILLNLHEIFKSLIHFGETRGIVFSEDAKTFGDGIDDEARDILARRAMGLPVE